MRARRTVMGALSERVASLKSAGTPAGTGRPIDSHSVQEIVAMSGHSKWSSIKHKKAAVDAKRGKIFTKLIREITVAARIGGGDPEANPRLRLALDKARGQNLPNDTVRRAIAKGVGEEDGESYEEVIYEGYGPHRIAVVVEALTDNRNRTASSIRHTFTKFDGNLGSSNSVLYMFDHRGVLTVSADAIDEDTLTEYALEAGVEDLEREEDTYYLTCPFAQLGPVRAFLEGKEVPVESAELQRLPQMRVLIEDKEEAQKVLSFLETLEEDDDVQKVYSNLDLPEPLLAELG
jgi:YebC/PmpR family DNA-binding regulatory protein